FGADGRGTRLEEFDPDRDDEALARFDELTAAPGATRIALAPSQAAKRLKRRVRANAATAHAARIDAAIIARDADVLPTEFADDLEVVDHTTGATYDRRGLLAAYLSPLSSHDPT